LLALALAAVLSFAAGVGSTLVYLQVERGEIVASVPLIEAEKSPTRVRPDGFDIAGRRIPPSGAITSPAMAMSDSDLSLPIQGIPEPLEIIPPSQGHVVVELPPAGSPIAGLTPALAEAGKVADVVAPSANASAFRVQLASMRTADAAASELNRLNQLFAAELSAVDLAVERIDLGQRGVYFRVLSAPVADRPAASDLCASLTARRAQCQVMASNVGATRLQGAQAAAKQPVKSADKAVAAAAPEPATVPSASSAIAAAPVAVPSSNGVRAQLASLRSLDGATRELNRLSRLYPQLLDQAALSVSRVDLGDRGIFYRILTAPFPDRSTAGELCHRLEANQAGCVLISQRSKAA
jgi:hypothetical protein